MLNLNSRSTSTSLGLTSNQENGISNLPETTLGSEQVLCSESHNSLMMGSSSSSDFSCDGETTNSLNGGTNQNCLIGTEGDDILIDSDGGSLMMGGGGADKFWISSSNASQIASTILDFNTGTDAIQISGGGIDFNSLVFEQTDGETNIYHQDNLLATLVDVDKDSLTSENFIFTDEAIANQLDNSVVTSETANGFNLQGIADFSSIETETPTEPIADSEEPINGSIDILPGIDLGNIDQFLGSFINDFLSNTSLQDIVSIFFQDSSSSQSQLISTSSYPSSENVTASSTVENTSVEFLGTDKYVYGIPEKKPGNIIPDYLD